MKKKKKTVRYLPAADRSRAATNKAIVLEQDSGEPQKIRAGGKGSGA
jgi:hypothetical protein